MNSHFLRILFFRTCYISVLLTWSNTFGNTDSLPIKDNRDNIIQLINAQYEHNSTHTVGNYIIEVEGNPVNLNDTQKESINKELNALKILTGINIYVLIPSAYPPKAEETDENIFVKLAACTFNAVNKSILGSPLAMSVLINIDSYQISSDKTIVQFRPMVETHMEGNDIRNLLRDGFQNLREDCDFKRHAGEAAMQFVLGITSIIKKTSSTKALNMLIQRRNNCEESVYNLAFQCVLDSDLQTITADQRIDLIKCLDNFPSTVEDEKIILRVLSTTPVGQRQNLLEKLLSANVYSDRLISAIDGDEFIELVNILCSWLKPPSQNELPEILGSVKTFFFDPKDKIDCSFDAAGNMIFKTLIQYPGPVSPHGYVPVIFRSKFFFGGQRFNEGEITMVPGLLLWALANKLQYTQLRSTLNFGLLVFNLYTLPAVCLANISLTAKVLQYANTAAGVVSSVGDVVIDEAMEYELRGTEFLKYWRLFNITYQVVGVSQLLFTVTKTLQGIIKNLDKSKLSTNLAKEIDELEPALEEVSQRCGKSLEKEGNTALGPIDDLAKGGDEVAGITTALVRSGEDFTILANARKLPGTSVGNGNIITGKWLRGTEGNAGLFPKSIADKLKGRQFGSFDEFREAFWKEVANDPNLAGQFRLQNVGRMKDGKAPIAVEEQWLGEQKSYILHHKTPINQGGGVYDMDNLYIVTPRYHKEILDPAYHYGYGY